MRRRKRPSGWLTLLTLTLSGSSALAHTPLFVVVDTTVTPPRLKIAPGSVPTLNGEINLNFAPAGVYAGLFVTDLPGYDATLFPFSLYPGATLRLERVHFPDGFGMYQSAGSTTAILTQEGELRSFSGHAHFVHHADAPGVYKASFRYVDAGGQLVASEVFTVTFRAFQAGGDGDADGAPDASDNCVDDFDVGLADVDGDTVGDVCDCCPDDSNRAQLDLDRDEQCDACNCAGQPCPVGDVNYDDAVDLLDIVYARNRASPNTFPPAAHAALVCDLNGDGQIDVEDLAKARSLFP